MRYVIIALSIVNGAWMLIDGIYVIANGKYIGPEKPGPWASVIGFTGIDVFKLGPLFVLFGVAWLVFVAGLLAHAGWARSVRVALSILTLWYLPFGTLISVIVIAGPLFFVER